MLKNRSRLFVVILFIFVFTITLVLSTSFLYAEHIERSKALYNSYCIHCHGTSGGGDGPAARELNPKPKNFQDSTEMSQVTQKMMEKAIVEGVPGTAMRAWGTILKPQEVKEISEYIKTFIKE
jgi:high-affinity iron transporter